jgi:hypothetical protein
MGPSVNTQDFLRILSFYFSNFHHFKRTYFKAKFPQITAKEMKIYKQQSIELKLLSLFEIVFLLLFSLSMLQRENFLD